MQYNTVQDNIVQHNTVQYKTIQCNSIKWKIINLHLVYYIHPFSVHLFQQAGLLKLTIVAKHDKGTFKIQMKILISHKIKSDISIIEP